MIEASQLTLMGPGLLGASVGLALKAAGYRGTIVGLGRTLQTPRRAVAVGACDLASDDPAVIADSEMVLIAVPLSGFDAVFSQIAEHDHQRLVITDVGSTKGDVVRKAQQYLPVPSRFVGSHPMAGSEQVGPDAAKADLFKNKPCILCQVPGSDPYAMSQVQELWRSLGANLLYMDPIEHDRAVAATSHLPHAMASLLVHAAMDLGGWDVASTGFQSTTRLASGNPAMRSDVMLANAPQLDEALAVLAQKIKILRQALQREDREAVRTCLEQAKARREAWVEQRKEMT